MLFQKIPESPAEELAIQGFRRFGLKPKRNYKVEYFYIDFAFPEKMVGIEINSIKWHKSFEKDLRRWKFLEARGWKMYKFMAKQVMQNKNLPAAYIYKKEFREDENLLKIAEFEIYKFLRSIMTDEERKQQINKILE